MTNRLLRELLAHTITKLADADASFGKTKLVKLLYLMDVENWRRRRRTISGLKWRFYHYGPYAFEIDAALDELALDIPQESVATESGFEATVFRPDRGLRPRLGEYVASPSEFRLVNRVIRDWGEAELNPLLDHVYFETEPMQRAKRGDALDFSTIQPRRIVPRETKPPRMPAERLSEFRSRFAEARAKRVRQPLLPAPRFDAVYEEGLARLNADEDWTIPPDVVDIPDEVKERLRQQGEDEFGG